MLVRTHHPARSCGQIAPVTLNQPVTAAIPPGEEELFWLAVDIASSSLETAPGDAEELETLARSLNVIFRAQETV